VKLPALQKYVVDVVRYVSLLLCAGTALRTYASEFFWFLPCCVLGKKLFADFSPIASSTFL
jgi:hypothetical protein